MNEKNGSNIMRANSRRDEDADTHGRSTLFRGNVRLSVTASSTLTFPLLRLAPSSGHGMIPATTTTATTGGWPTTIYGGIIFDGG
jgi:hypothetical protein